MSFGSKAPASTAGKASSLRSEAPASTAGKEPGATDARGPRSYGTRQGSRSPPPTEAPVDSGVFMDFEDGVYRCRTCGWEVLHEDGCCDGAGAHLVTADAWEDADGEAYDDEPFSRRFVSWPRGDTPQLDDDDDELEDDPSGRLSKIAYSELLHRGCTDAMIQRFAVEWSYEGGIVGTFDPRETEQLLVDELDSSITSVRFYLGRVVLLDDDDADGSRFVYRLFHFVEVRNGDKPAAHWRFDVFDERLRWMVTLDVDDPSVAIIKLTMPAEPIDTEDEYAGSDVVSTGSDIVSLHTSDDSDDPDVDDLKMDVDAPTTHIKAIVSDEEEDVEDEDATKDEDAAQDEEEDELMDELDEAQLEADLRDKAAAVSAWRGQ